MSNQKKNLDNSTVAILGVSYKPNVHDIQIAPSEQIIKLLNQKNVKLKIFDPYFISETVFEEKVKNSIDDAINASDAVVIVTGHKEFDNLDLEKISKSMNKPILIDCTGKINPLQAKSKGIIFRGIGRGN